MNEQQRERVKQFVEKAIWYHTISFPDGMTSHGYFDHRDRLGQYQFPENLEGKTVLDVGCADGFFSFELEKRGASVTSIDTHSYGGEVGHTDISPNAQESYEKKYDRHAKEMQEYADVKNILGLDTLNRFFVARKLLHSSAAFEYKSIYDLKNWGKKFDLVVCGDLIEHLKDPLGAIENLVSVTGHMCVITVSSAIKAPKNYFFPKIVVKGLDRMLRKVGIRVAFQDEQALLAYYGNVSGGSFFHFYPGTFRQAALASGFNKVDIASEFDVVIEETGVVNHHAVFHCYV